jgi:hypothetical protein
MDMTAGSRGERLWLWLVVNIGTRQSSPRQFFRFWRLMSIGWLFGSAVGLWILIRGDPKSGVFLTIMLIFSGISIACCSIAAADLRTPRVIEGRVTGMKTVDGKGLRTDAAAHSRRYTEEHGYYSHRVTIAEENGEAHTFRATVNTLLDVSEGDTVRARVGMRLRWIYKIAVIESSSEAAR